jgi:hypothetical protein
MVIITFTEGAIQVIFGFFLVLVLFSSGYLIYELIKLIKRKNERNNSKKNS